MAKAVSARQKSSSPRSREASRKLRNEIIGIALVAVGVAVALALFTFDKRDPSWLSSVPRSSTGNWIGPVGANAAGLLYSAFGWVALGVPVVLFMLGYWRLRESRVSLSWLKLGGLALMIVSLTGLLAVADSGRPEAFYLGGWVGRLLVYGDDFGLSRFLGAVGATIALLLAFASGLLMATPLSVAGIAGLVMNLSDRERQAGLAVTASERFRAWWQHWQAERQERRAEHERQLEQERAEQEAAARDAEKVEAKGKAAVTGAANAARGGEKAVSEVEAKGAATPAATTEVASPTISKNATPAALSNGAARAPQAEKSAAESKSELSAAARAASGPQSRPSNGATAAPPAARRGAQTDDEVEADGADGESFDDFAAAEGAGQRSVEEMMATASVKRAALADEQARTEAKATAKAPVKNVSRTAVEYKLPTVDMLTPPSARSEVADDELLERAQQLAEKCKEFNVSGQVKQISPGPVVTTFEFKPDPGVKYSRVTSLVDDLCLGLKAESVRIDRIPGKSTVGIEVPNTKRDTIRLREVIESKKFTESHSKLTLALGKTIDGSNYAADLARMPHLLIAGATGAGKSVALNSILVSILYKASPDEVKLILIDPKRLELGLYSEIPHLLTPIVVDPKRASYALKWAVGEMESRYKHLAAFGVRNIDQYNGEVCAAVDRNLAEDSDELPKPLPYIVVIIDELADLMMVSARDVEESITRLAQMARAVGIHLVLATQRPSVDVITGLIKANFPSRISFRVSSKVDSRTIIDTNGAEGLLGQGDMLFLPPGTSRLVRVHGAYVDEKEVKRICDHARAQSRPAYDDKIVMSEKEIEGEEMGDAVKDEKYDEALRIVIEQQKASTSLLQRRLRIGYGRAASIIDMMFREGVVGPEDGSKPRAVLVKRDFLERLDQLKEEEF
jgi:DNA segregation ATPase FtsK/SpoIIIE, S-DNA-T family